MSVPPGGSDSGRIPSWESRIPPLLSLHNASPRSRWSGPAVAGRDGKEDDCPAETAPFSQGPTQSSTSLMEGLLARHMADLRSSSRAQSCDGMESRFPPPSFPPQRLVSGSTSRCERSVVESRHCGHTRCAGVDSRPARSGRDDACTDDRNGPSTPHHASNTSMPVVQEKESGAGHGRVGFPPLRHGGSSTSFPPQRLVSGSTSRCERSVVESRHCGHTRCAGVDSRPARSGRDDACTDDRDTGATAHEDCNVRTPGVRVKGQRPGK